MEGQLTVPTDSFEFRYFRPGLLPGHLEQLFRSSPRFGDPITKQEEREDIYLLPEATENLGVKISRGNLEIKGRLAAEAFAGLNGRVAGQVERWRKWAWRCSVQPATEAAEVKVTKRRLQRAFEVQAAGSILALKQGEYPAIGFVVELTEVTVSGGPWWSVGFDVFGPVHSCAATLEIAIAFVFAEWQTEDLPRFHESLSYPAWLLRT